MKNSRFTLHAVLLASAIAVSWATGAVQAVAQSSSQYDIVADQYGSLIGQTSGTGISIDTSTNTASVPVVTRTSAPTGVRCLRSHQPSHPRQRLSQ